MSRPWTRDEMRTTAWTLAREHDPDHQDHRFRRRCELCGYRPSPCEVAELAAIVLQLLDGET